MVRLLLALGLFIINITAAAYVVDANNIVAVLEGIFGNISNEFNIEFFHYFCTL